MVATIAAATQQVDPKDPCPSLFRPLRTVHAPWFVTSLMTQETFGYLQRSVFMVKTYSTNKETFRPATPLAHTRFSYMYHMISMPLPIPTCIAGSPSYHIGLTPISRQADIEMPVPSICFSA